MNLSSQSIKWILDISESTQWYIPDWWIGLEKSIPYQNINAQWICSHWVLIIGSEPDFPATLILWSPPIHIITITVYQDTITKINSSNHNYIFKVKGNCKVSIQTDSKWRKFWFWNLICSNWILFHNNIYFSTTVLSIWKLIVHQSNFATLL